MNPWEDEEEGGGSLISLLNSPAGICCSSHIVTFYTINLTAGNNLKTGSFVLLTFDALPQLSL